MRFIKGDNLKHAIDRFHASRRASGHGAFRQVLRRFLDVCTPWPTPHSRRRAAPRPQAG